jgi:hypothetical protein
MLLFSPYAIVIQYFNTKLATYQAGSLYTCISVWEKLTSDPEILETEFDTFLYNNAYQFK